MSGVSMTALAVHRELAEQRQVRIARIPVAKVRLHPRNVREDLGDLTELASSLRHEGQHQLVTVHRKGEYFELIDGHRRYGAAVIAGLRTLQAQIVPTRTDAQVLATMLTTGVHSRPLSEAERSRAVRALLEQEHVPIAEVAARCGVTPATIRRWRDRGHPSPAEPAEPVAPRRRRRRTAVGVGALTELATRFEQLCTPVGLSLADTVALLGEIRALTNPAGSE